MKSQIRATIKNINRTDWHSAEKFFRANWKDEKLYISYTELIANSMCKANMYGESCWSITLFDKKIRLDVGQVEVLTLYSDGIRLVYKEPLIINGSKISTINEPYYKAVPIPSNIYNLTESEVINIPKELIKAHNEYIKCAAELKRITP